MRKLTDAQVKTMMHILVHSPDAPTNLDRFPTLRMMLENGIITKSLSGKLWFNTECAENAYQYVVPANLLDNHGLVTSFDQLEKAGMLAFNPSADPTPEDTFYFYDTVVLCQELEKLGGIVNIDAGEIRFADSASTVDLVLGRAIIDAYEQKYPQTKADTN